MALSRRQFIRNVSVAGGALSIGFTLSGCSDKDGPIFDASSFQPNAFVRINEEGQVTVQIHKAEMGQGVVTGIITLIAEELEVHPSAVSYEMAPVHSVYADPEMALQITGGSASIRIYYDILRQAGASTRATLIRSAAQATGIAEHDLYAKNGRVYANSGAYSASFGELVAAARSIAVPTDISLKSPAQFKLIGRYDRRLDSAPKVDGSAQFGIDVGPEDCLVAVLLRCPHFGGTLERFEAEVALQHPGVVDIFQVDNAVAVVAEGYWPALKASEKVEVVFTPADNVLRSSEQISQAMTAAFESGEFNSVREEEGQQLHTAGSLVKAEYRVPFLAHATMEPQNATAHVTDTLCEIWVGSQSPDIAQDIAARILDRPRETVIVHNQFLGGGFGRRANADNVAEAVAVAARVKRPIKVIWTREDDMRHDFYRPATAGRLSAQVAEDGQISDWKHQIVGPSISQQVFPVIGKAMLPSWAPTRVLNVAGDWVSKDDSSAVEGAKELPYEFDGIWVEYHNLQVPVPLGFWRSVGHSHTAFIVESFVDELAAAAAVDAVEFRRQHLPLDSRERRTLDAVAKLANWGQAPAGRYQGVALHESFGTVVAEVAEISMIKGKMKIENFFCAVDCGQVINPDIVHDQMEGGIIFALTAALYGEISLKDGAVEQSNFHDYQMLRHNETPIISVHILDSTAPPSGVGEPGTPPAAPALANAIYAATGQRLRQLPLKLS
jgi:isoquinoline 1-oxidoreductase beta subunit